MILRITLYCQGGSCFRKGKSACKDPELIIWVELCRRHFWVFFVSSTSKCLILFVSLDGGRCREISAQQVLSCDGQFRMISVCDHDRVVGQLPKICGSASCLHSLYSKPLIKEDFILIKNECYGLIGSYKQFKLLFETQS